MAIGEILKWVFSYTINGTRYMMAKTADQVMHWGISGVTGAPSLRMDHQFHASHSYTYMELDASTDEWGYVGPMRPKGTNKLPRRLEYKWIAGLRGKPGINADIQNSAESVRMIADPDFEILGTNGTTALCTHNAEGGITLTTAGAGNDQEILCPHLDTSQSGWTQTTWGTDQSTTWECEIATPATITTLVIWAGLKLTNTDVIATDNDSCYFRFQPSVSAFWQTNYSIANTDTTATSTVTAAASTRFHFKISIDSSRIAKMYINGVLTTTSTALSNAVDLIPYIGVMGTTGARAVDVYGQAISRKYAA